MTSSIGCDCSQEHPWVVACFHGEGSLVVTLRDYHSEAYLGVYPDSEDDEPYRYEVMGGYEYGPFVQGYQGDNLRDAMASLFAIKDASPAYQS